MSLIILSLSAFVISFGVTNVVRHYALYRNLLDQPNHRSAHTKPTPRGGGLAIITAFMPTLYFLMWSHPPLMTTYLAIHTGLLVAAIGLIDDIKSLPARWRFSVHLLSAALALIIINGFPSIYLPYPLNLLSNHSLITPPNWIGYPLGILGLAWFLNLFNFMDGTDGIAASQSLFVSLGLFSFLVIHSFDLALIPLSLAFASFGFLVWNWPSAKIFMGDVGSGYLGFILGLLVLLASQYNAVLLYCGLILMGIFIVDATYTLFVRVISGQKWHEAHCSHTYQIISRRIGHTSLLLGCWAINLFWLLPMAILAYFYQQWAFILLCCAYAPLLHVAYAYGAGRFAK